MHVHVYMLKYTKKKNNKKNKKQTKQVYISTCLKVYLLPWFPGK